MNFAFEDALPVLSRTPAVLRSLLADLPESWIRATEGPDSWSPFDIVGHLIHGERTDWIVRTEILLAHGESGRSSRSTALPSSRRRVARLCLSYWTPSPGFEPRI